MSRWIPVLIVLLAAPAACGERGETPASRAVSPPAPADESGPEPEEVPTAPGDRGWEPVDRSLPRLAHAGGLWRLGDEPLEYARGEARDREVLLEGKMVLDDSRPMRRAFWLAPHYDGCVDAHARFHRPHWIRVVLPDGDAVQVTDEDLQVQGRLAGEMEDGRLRFRATAVSPRDARLERSRAR
ncbi:MAG: hypothetical protein ACQEXJ_16925 [Myxococcota bacterium]